MDAHGSRGELHRRLAEDGYVHLPAAGLRTLLDVLEGLGRVIHVEEVVVAEESKSLVRSEDALPFHTDHHRADIIVWFCFSQTNAGGETLLVDAREAYSRLTQAQRKVLEGVMLEEHSIFSGDAERHPMVTFRDGAPRFYYSYWLADPAMSPEQRAAFDGFTELLAQCRRHRIRLAPGDILAIDNGRLLHGRTQISGSQERHLRRYWLEGI